MLIDEFPSDGTQWTDRDGDGHGDNPYGTEGDWFPDDPAYWSDNDRDGVADELDAFPNEFLNPRTVMVMGMVMICKGTVLTSSPMMPQNGPTSMAMAWATMRMPSPTIPHSNPTVMGMVMGTTCWGQVRTCSMMRRNGRTMMGMDWATISQATTPIRTSTTWTMMGSTIRSTSSRGSSPGDLDADGCPDEVRLFPDNARIQRWRCSVTTRISMTTTTDGPIRMSFDSGPMP